MDVTILGVGPGERQGQYVVDALIDCTTCCLRITVSEDRIGDTTLQLANSDWETERLFGFHQILHGDVLRFVMKWHGGEQPDLPQVVTDGPD